jgi:hypothetical protein
MRLPILPTKQEQGWSETASSYRQSLHESLYPKDVAWNPSVGSVTSASITGSYVPMGRFYSFAIDIQGPTTSTAGYIDLPFEVAQLSVFNVAVSGLNKPAVINKGASRLYLPDWSGAANALISGVVVA